MHDARSKWASVGICAALIAMCVAVFLPVRDFDFVNYDDGKYVYDNPMVQQAFTAEALGWAFTEEHASNWHPLTWMSHMLDCSMFGVDAGRHHLVNLFFHILNSVLLFLVLKRLTRGFWPSAFVAALFAIHPLHVESVAWVSERKDVLSTLFWILSIWAYLWYAAKPEWARNVLVCAMFSLGLLAKPMVVTLPFVLLLLDYWPLRRAPALAPSRDWLPLIAEKTPLFVLSIGSCVATFLAQSHGGAVSSIGKVSFGVRCANALDAYQMYLAKMLWPMNLAIHYPHPGDALAIWRPILALAILAAITVFAIRWRRRFPFLIVGWLIYLGTLVPVIGIVQVGEQAYADRYTYVPLIGIFIVIAWGAPQLLCRLPKPRIVLAVVALCVLLGLGYRARGQVGYWENSFTLFERSIEITERNVLAYNNLGTAYTTIEEFEEAADRFRQAVAYEPEYANAHYNLGNTLHRLGRIDEAVHHVQEAIRLDPTTDGAYTTMGNIVFQDDRFEEAIGHFLKAIEVQPTHPGARFNLGITYARIDQPAKAVPHLTKAIQLNPTNLDARMCLGDCHIALGNREEGIMAYAGVAAMSSIPVGALTRLAETIESEEEIDWLDADFGSDASLFNNMGNGFAMAQKWDLARAAFSKALEIDPNHQAASENLSKLKSLQ